MKKPTPYENYDNSYDLEEILKFIQKKYKMNPYDFHASHTHFDKWCDQKGFGKIDPEGKKRSHSNVWFSQYKKDPTGDALCPPYEDFWGPFMGYYSTQERDEPFVFSVALLLKDTDTPLATQQFLSYIEQEFGSEVKCFMLEA